MRVFLDTNILIDLLDTTRPEHEASTRLLRAIQAGKIAACISPISIVNTIYVLRKVVPPRGPVKIPAPDGGHDGIGRP